MGSELIGGIILMVIGLVFFFNSREIGEGAFKFYRMIYTKKNLKIMFRVAGAILVFGGLLLMLLG